MKLSWLCACFASLLISASSTWAQSQPADKAAAEALFDRGLALMHEGNFSEACARLEQSQAIEHGIGTMLYLAECYEKLGRTASAWALFREASSLAAAAGQSERADMGRTRADKLERSLATLTVDVPQGNVLPGLTVSRNGAAVPQGVWGISIPVDPGLQRIEAQAPSRESWAATVQVRESASERVTVPSLVPLATAEVSETRAPVSSVGAVQVSTGSAPEINQRDSQPGTTQRVIGLAVGGAGVVTLAVGGGFGIRAIIKNNDAESECPDDRCTPAGKQHTEQANDAARVSNGAFIAGGILVAAGLVVFLTAPESRALSMRPSLSPQYAGLDVGGAF